MAGIVCGETLLSQAAVMDPLLNESRDKNCMPSFLITTVWGADYFINHQFFAMMPRSFAVHPTRQSSNPLQQLYDLDKASPHYHQQLSDFLCGEEYGNPSSELQSPDLASLAEYLDGVRH